MAYTITKSDGSTLVTISDGTINSTKTSIQLIGRGFPNYGDELNTNFVRMLEHFANDTAPLNAIAGQIWLDTANNLLKFWDGSTWNILASNIVGSTGYVQIAGDTMIGPLQIDHPFIDMSTWTGDDGLSSPSICVVGDATTDRPLKFSTINATGTGTRWVMGADDDDESGSNAGSDFYISRWSDNDTVISDVLNINRATGNFNVNGGKISNIGTPAAAADAATKEYVDLNISGGGGVSSGAITAGAILASATTLGNPFLLCDGSAVSRTTYVDLFNAIGETYGVGDGITTFNLPNLSGRVIIGPGDSGTTGSVAVVLGGTGGEAKHVLSEAELPSHTHTGGVDTYVGSQATGGSAPHGVSAVTGSTGGDQSHENMPPYLVLNWYISASTVGGNLTGEIKMLAGADVPPGWLACDGSLISESIYTDLFSKIGYTYGSGSGTFALPNLSGRLPVCIGDSDTTGSSVISLGDSDGSAKHQLTEEELAAHTHDIITSSDDANSSGGGAGYGIWINQIRSTESTGGDVAHENMPPYLGLNFIIYTGVY